MAASVIAVLGTSGSTGLLGTGSRARRCGAQRQAPHCLIGWWAGVHAGAAVCLVVQREPVADLCDGPGTHRLLRFASCFVFNWVFDRMFGLLRHGCICAGVNAKIAASPKGRCSGSLIHPRWWWLPSGLGACQPPSRDGAHYFRAATVTPIFISIPFAFGQALLVHPGQMVFGSCIDGEPSIELTRPCADPTSSPIPALKEHNNTVVHRGPRAGSSRTCGRQVSKAA